MEKVLELYKYIDGVNDAPFPNDKEQVVISSFRYDAKRMGGAPTISCSFMHHLCLDKMWDYNVYAIFNGEKYFVKQIPTSSYDNTDSRYKHELELASERVILDNVYVYDVVDSDSSSDKPVSNSSNFAFFGDIHEFASRLNQSLKYSKVGYSVVVDEGITSEPKMVSFQDQFFSNAIQESYNTFNIPYYFVGKVIHFGYTNNAITNTFKYGQDESLLSLQKQNANYKIVNRVTGVGSADNIPYYYPNDYESKEEVEGNGGTWINPQTNLMPSIYRESLGDERFYNALNNTYRIPNSDKYYEFANPYVEGKPKEHIVNFEDIKPTIKGITNAEGLRIDMFSEFAFDENDNDEVDEEGNYLHPYFFAKLRKFDGEHGFNLFDHSIDEQEMTISMTSGSCGACEFVIGVDESTQKNIVQVDDSGNLVRDDNGNIKFGDAQDRQNDTSNYEVWIALRKDVDTFGVIMPNASNNYKPSVNDTFVILHIDLPKAYIIAAEDKLKEQLINYMSLNNSEKFNFSISFSRIFFAENPDILSQLNENARIQIEYDNTMYELYISSYSYSMSNDKPLPEIRVELTDTLTISQNALQTAISEVKNEILASGGGSFDFLKQGLKYFLRKDVSDKTPHSLGVGKDLTVGRSLVSKFFAQGELGNGFILKYDEETGQSYFEVDRMLVRKVAYFVELIIKTLSHVGGQIVLSPASMRCSLVEEYGEYYRCYFLAEHEGKSIAQEFRVNDQARSQTFNVKTGVNHNVSSQYYWRLVVGISDEPIEVNGQKYHYIDLSKIDCDAGSLPPLAGDDIVQLGNRTDPERQNAIILSTVGEDAPSFKQYEGIQYYTLAGKEVTVISPKGNVITGDFISKSGKDLEGYIDDLGARLDDVQYQTDKHYTIWFYDYNPTLENYPASEWMDDDAKREHVQDIFYNEEEGLAFRFLEVSEGVFVWDDITDHETIKALEKAAKAQKTADGKIRNFVAQPVPPYDEGDRWSNASYTSDDGTVLYDNDDLVCVTSKAEGEVFDIADWQYASGQNSSELKKIYSEFVRVDNEIAARVTAEYVGGQIAQAEMRVAEAVAGLYVKTDTFNSSIEALSGQISLKVSSNNIINSINLSPEAVTINASKINLNGQVTFSMLAQDTQDTINGKATQANIDASIAAYGNTIIEGGYIKTSLINADAIVAKQLQATDEWGNVLTANSTGLFITGKEGTERVRLRGDASSAYLRMQTTSGHTSDLYASGLSFTYGDYSTIITYSGITLGDNCNIKGFKLGNTSPTSVTKDTDFIRTGSAIALPAPSSCRGKVILTRTTAECVISSTGKNIYPRSGDLAESITRNKTAQFFISDGSYWHEFYCG